MNATPAPRLTTNQRAVMTLANFAPGSTVAHIALNTGLTETAVRRSLRSLDERGLAIVTELGYVYAIDQSNGQLIAPQHIAAFADACEDEPTPERIEPAEHAKHVRWLRNQYALDADAAEAEAQRRYVQWPAEVDRWGGLVVAAAPLTDDTEGDPFGLARAAAQRVLDHANYRLRSVRDEHSYVADEMTRVAALDHDTTRRMAQLDRKRERVARQLAERSEEVAMLEVVLRPLLPTEAK